MSWSEFIEYLSKLVRYIRFHSGQFKVCTSDVRKWSTRDTWFELTVRPPSVHSLDELSANGLYYLSINGLDLLSINGRPHDVRVLHEFSVTGLKIISVNVFPHDTSESLDITLESGLPGLNVLGPESALNGLKGLN